MATPRSTQTTQSAASGGLLHPQPQAAHDAAAEVGPEHGVEQGGRVAHGRVQVVGGHDHAVAELDALDGGGLHLLGKLGAALLVFMASLSLVGRLSGSSVGVRRVSVRLLVVGSAPVASHALYGCPGHGDGATRNAETKSPPGRAWQRAVRGMSTVGHRASGRTRRAAAAPGSSARSGPRRTGSTGARSPRQPASPSPARVARPDATSPGSSSRLELIGTRWLTQ